MISSLLLFTCQTASLTLEERGARVPVVLQEIAEKTGLSLRANRQLDNRVLTLRLSNVSVEETLAQVAYVLDAEWQVSGKKRVLVPSQKIAERYRREKEAQQLSLALKNITGFGKKYDTEHGYSPKALEAASQDVAAVKKLVEAIESGANPKIDTKEEDEDIAHRPEDRLLARLLTQVPQDTWSQLNEGDRIVYSNAPTHMQQSLPTSAEEAFGLYRSEWEIYRKFVPDESLSPADDDSAKPATRALTTIPKASRVTLAIQDLGILGGISASVQVVTPDGSLAGYGEETVVSFLDPAVSDRISTTNLDRAPPDKMFQFVESLDAQRLRQFYAWVRPSASNVPTPDDWAKRALDTTAFEQLGVIQGERWVALADFLGLNLVGSPSDLQFFISADYQAVKSNSKPEPISRLNEIHREQSWLTVKPPAGTDEFVVDRSALKNLLDAIKAEAGMTIDAAAEYVGTAATNPPLHSWDVGFLAAFLKHDRGGAPLLASEEALALYHTLSPEQRQILFRQPLSFRQLSNGSLEWLAKNLFGAKERDEKSIEEPTETFPDGVPAEGTIQFTNESEDLTVIPVLPAGSPVRPILSAMPAASFGRMLAKGTKADPSQTSAALAVHSGRFRVGKRRRFTIHIRYAKGREEDLRLSEQTFPSSTLLTYPDLPEDFRKQVDKARKERESNMQVPAENSSPPNKTPPPQ